MTDKLVNVTMSDIFNVSGEYFPGVRYQTKQVARYG
eukprot:COSAG01_NODE_10178_length_2229_cov_4.487793_4_plen_36_part_00